MPVQSLSAFTVKLGGVPLVVIPDPSTDADPGDPSYEGSYASQDSSKQFERRDVPAYIRRFSRGAGLMAMRDDGDDGGYAWAENAITYGGNGVYPSGKQTISAASLGLSGTTGVTFSEIYGNDLYVPLQGTARMAKYANADPTGTPTYAPALNTFGSATESFHTGQIPTASALFADATATRTAGTVVPSLYVATYKSGTGSRIYEYNATSGWSASPVFASFQVTKMAVVWWEGTDGTGALRLVITTNTIGGIRHCIYGADPLLEASYVTPVQVGNPNSAIYDLVGGDERVFGVKRDGVWDFNEKRTRNLTPNWQQTRDARIGAGHGAIIANQHIVAIRGTGLDAYDLRLQGRQQPLNIECGPMHDAQDGHPIRGWITTICEHQGDVLAAVLNPDNKTTYIMRGKWRGTGPGEVNEPGAGPLVWYGAEQVLAPVGGKSVWVLHMRVTPSSIASTLPTGAGYLWMFTSVDWDVSSTGEYLYYAPVVTNTGPLSLAVSGASFPFAASATLYLTAQTWGDRNATKGIRRYDFVGGNMSASRLVTIKSRADGVPSTITDDSTWTSQLVADADADYGVPGDHISGHAIALKAVFTTPSPYTTAPILYELSPRARVVRDAFQTRVLWVPLERDYPLRDGQADIRSPDATFNTVTEYQNAADPVSFVDEALTSHTVYVEQPIRFVRSRVGGEWRTVARLELSVVT